MGSDPEKNGPTQTETEPHVAPGEGLPPLDEKQKSGGMRKFLAKRWAVGLLCGLGAAAATFAVAFVIAFVYSLLRATACSFGFDSDYVTPLAGYIIGGIVGAGISAALAVALTKDRYLNRLSGDNKIFWTRNVLSSDPITGNRLKTAAWPYWLTVLPFLALAIFLYTPLNAAFDAAQQIGKEALGVAGATLPALVVWWIVYPIVIRVRFSKATCAHCGCVFCKEARESSRMRHEETEEKVKKVTSEHAGDERLGSVTIDGSDYSVYEHHTATYTEVPVYRTVSWDVVTYSVRCERCGDVTSAKEKEKFHSTGWQ